MIAEQPHLQASKIARGNLKSSKAEYTRGFYHGAIAVGLIWLATLAFLAAMMWPMIAETLR